MAAADARIYDARGSQIANLVDEHKPAGRFAVPWRGQDDAGRAVTAGVYFVRFDLNGETKTRKVVLVK